MSPSVRRLMLTTHLATSVGWVGAVLVFLVLAAMALASDNEVLVRGAYLLMAPAAWFVLVPLAHASLISGVVLSLGTSWGLFKHYWVIFKLILTAFATVILLVYMGTFRQMAGVAADPIVNIDTVRNASPLVHAVLAFLLLMATTVLGVYKPLGLTPHGRRADAQRRAAAQGLSAGASASTHTPSLSMNIVAAVILGIVLLLTAMHLLGAGFRH